MTMKKWGNSILLVNLKYWKCVYCGKLLKDDTLFGIMVVKDRREAQVFCSKSCLKIYTIKMVAAQTDS